MSFGSNSDIRGIFTQRRPPEENEECGDENLSDEYVLEKTGDEYEEQEYEDDPEEREEIDEIIPESPVRNDISKSKEEPLKYSVTSKISKTDRDYLRDLEVAYGIDTAKAIRQCIIDARNANGDSVKNTARKIRKLRNKQ